MKIDKIVLCHWETNREKVMKKKFHGENTANSFVIQKQYLKYSLIRQQQI